jgi:AraC-like DNA-binding protein
VLRQPAPAEGVTHQRFAPGPSLESFVQHFWTVTWDLRGKPPTKAETLPHPCVHLVFEGARAVVTGVPRHRFERVLRGKGRVFAIKFRPAAFGPLLRGPLSKLSDRTVSLRTVFGSAGQALQERIQRELDPKRCVSLARDFLEPRLPEMPDEIAQLRDLVERIAADPRLTRVDQLVELAGVERRTLQRRFSAAVGASPKWVIQRYRLHEAAERLAGPDAPDMASLAVELGYFDQSHFIRDFKATVGRSPARYRAQ